MNEDLKKRIQRRKELLEQGLRPDEIDQALTDEGYYGQPKPVVELKEEPKPKLKPVKREKPIIIQQEIHRYPQKVTISPPPTSIEYELGEMQCVVCRKIFKFRQVCGTKCSRKYIARQNAKKQAKNKKMLKELPKINPIDLIRETEIIKNENNPTNDLKVEDAKGMH